VQVEPVETSEALLAGARCEVVSRSEKRLVWRVYGLPGQKQTLSAIAYGGAASVRASGAAPVALPAGMPREISLAWPGKPCASRAEGGPIAPAPGTGPWKLAGKCRVEVPADAKASLHVLCEIKTLKARALACTASHNGKPLTVRACRQPEKQHDAPTGRLWTWFEAQLPAGSGEVTVEITEPKPGDSPADQWARGEAGWWLQVDRPMQAQTVTIDADRPLEADQLGPLPLAVRMDRHQELLTIHAPSRFAAGWKWPKSATLWLDELAPDSCSQQWGSLARNRSVWDKPMLIAGQSFRRGLGAHAAGCLEYDLEGSPYRRFRAMLGRDAHAGDGRIVLEVWLDGRRAFSSGPRTKASPPLAVDVDLSGAKRLELRTLDGGDGISGDHGDWADARLDLR
jgi:hypothetical protein